jgi:transcriptional regulator with XRE-family HTH domain
MAKSFNVLREKMSPERRARMAKRTREMLEEMALQDLRQALNLTQTQVAELMKMNQAAVSKMEHQGDMYISTLQRFVTALGGSLQLVARFPDREVVLNQFEQV